MKVLKYILIGLGILALAGCVRDHKLAPSGQLYSCNFTSYGANYPGKGTSNTAAVQDAVKACQAATVKDTPQRTDCLTQSLKQKTEDSCSLISA